MDKEIIKIIEVNNLEKDKTQIITESFNCFFEQIKEWENKAKSITITDISQTKEMSEAREIRLSLKDIRVKAEKTRKELKERSLRESRAIDGIANIIKVLIVPLEEHLDKQENFIQKLEEEKKEKVNAERIVKLQPFVEDVEMYNLKEMSIEGFENLLNSSRIAFNTQKEAEEKAEKERIEKEKEYKKEQERIRKENIKLQKEAKEKEAEREKERKIEADKLAKVEAEREKERKEKEVLENKIVQEKADKEAKEKETQAMQKKKDFTDFLKKNGYTEETKNNFIIKEDNENYLLFKKVAEFNKK